MQNADIYLPYFSVRHLWCFFGCLHGQNRRVLVQTEGGKFVTCFLRLKGKLLYVELCWR